MSQGTHSLCEHRHHEERNPFMWCFMMVHIDFTQKLQTTSLLRLILSNLQSGTHSLFIYHTIPPRPPVSWCAQHFITSTRNNFLIEPTKQEGECFQLKALQRTLCFILACYSQYSKSRGSKFEIKRQPYFSDYENRIFYKVDSYRNKSILVL
jgi:hypothetical protein